MVDEQVERLTAQLEKCQAIRAKAVELLLEYADAAPSDELPDPREVMRVAAWVLEE